MPRFKSRLLQYGDRPAFARPSVAMGTQVIIVWDGGVAVRDFTSIEAAQQAVDDLPLELSRELLEGDGYAITERA